MPSDRVSQKCPVSIPFYEVKVESRKGNIFKFTSAISDECIDIYRDILHDDQMVTIVLDAHTQVEQIRRTQSKIMMIMDGDYDYDYDDHHHNEW